MPSLFRKTCTVPRPRKPHWSADCELVSLPNSRPGTSHCSAARQRRYRLPGSACLVAALAWSRAPRNIVRWHLGCGKAEEPAASRAAANRRRVAGDTNSQVSAIRPLQRKAGLPTNSHAASQFGLTRLQAPMPLKQHKSPEAKISTSWRQFSNSRGATPEETRRS